MKKLLLIAVLSLFVANAYALETKIYGEYQLGGTWLINHSLGDDNDKGGANADATFFRQYLRIFAEISPEPGTTIVLRTTPMDPPARKFGTGFGDIKNQGETNLDRAWIQYAVTDSLTVLGGRVNFNNFSASGWAQGMWDGGFAESGSGDGFAAVYAIGDHKLTAIYGKAYENSQGNPGNIAAANTNGRDNDAYILMADLKFGDLGINPRFTYAHLNEDGPATDTPTVMSFYIDGQYKPAMGLNVVAALGYVSGSDYNQAGFTGDDLAAFGAHVDVSYKTDAFKAGIRGAFSSYDEEDGAFGVGGDYDKTSLIDDQLFDTEGVMAMNVIQLYGEIYMGDLTIMPSFAYYMSNVDENNSVVVGEASAFIIGEDTKAYEFDLIARYKLTDYTGITAGYALAQVSDIADTYDADMAHKLFWTVSTKF